MNIIVIILVCILLFILFPFTIGRIIDPNAAKQADLDVAEAYGTTPKHIAALQSKCQSAIYKLRHGEDKKQFQLELDKIMIGRFSRLEESKYEILLEKINENLS